MRLSCDAKKVHGSAVNLELTLFGGRIAPSRRTEISAVLLHFLRSQVRSSTQCDESRTISTEAAYSLMVMCSGLVFGGAKEERRTSFPSRGFSVTTSCVAVSVCVSVTGSRWEEHRASQRTKGISPQEIY